MGWNKSNIDYVPEVDLVRTLAMIGVLIVHTTALTTVTLDPHSTFYWLYQFLNIAFKYGTPTFIFISSFVLFRSYMNRPVDKSLIKRFYRRRLLYIVLPYLIFSFIYTLMKSYFYYGFNGWLEWLTDFLYKLATGNAHAHLYFIIISIQFYLLFPAILLLFQRSAWLRKHSFWLGFALQWAFVLLNRYALQVPDKGSWALSYMSVYLLGAYVGIHYTRILHWFQLAHRRRTIVLLGIVCSLSIALHFGLYHVYKVHQISVHSLWYEFAWNAHTASAALLLFYVAHRLGHKLPEAINLPIRLFAQASFGIYLVHPLLLIFYEASFQTAHPYWYHATILMKGFFLLVGSYVVIRIGSALLQGASPFVLGSSLSPVRTRKSANPAVIETNLTINESK